MNLILSKLILIKKKEKKMKINEFNKKISEMEGGKRQLNIAEISEVTKIANELTNGALYSVIDSINTDS